MKARGIFGSIEARGKFGDIMVAFPWKDIQVIRVLKYPAQPRTPLVVAQRLHMANAITEWKASLFTAVDQRAWVSLASLRTKGETGPNQMTREYIRVARAPATWSRLRNGLSIPLAGIDRALIVDGDAGLTDVKVVFGSNIRYMYTTGVCTWHTGDLYWYFQIPIGTFAPGDRVFFQFFDAAALLTDAIGLTGIYSYTQT